MRLVTINITKIEATNGDEFTVAGVLATGGVRSMYDKEPIGSGEEVMINLDSDTIRRLYAALPPETSSSDPVDPAELVHA